MFFYKYVFNTFLFCLLFLGDMRNGFGMEWPIYQPDKYTLNPSAQFKLIDTSIGTKDDGIITYPYEKESSSENVWSYDKSFYVSQHPLGYCARINRQGKFELSWTRFITICNDAIHDKRVLDVSAKEILQNYIAQDSSSVKKKLSIFFAVHATLANLYKYPETNVEELSEEEENVCSSAEIISAHTPAERMTVKREVYEQTINERNALLQLKKDQEIYKKQLIEKENAINLCNDQIKELQKNIEKLQSEIEKISSAKAEDKKIIKDLNLAKEKLEVQLKEAETQKEEKEKLLQQELEHKNTLIQDKEKLMQKKETELSSIKDQLVIKNGEYTRLTQQLKEKNASYAPYYWACLVLILWLIRDHKFFLSYIY